jgi:hypothetical protein
MKEALPGVTSVNNSSKVKEALLIIAEGFEERSLSFLSSKNNAQFSKLILCKYHPPKKSLHDQLLKLAYQKCDRESVVELLFDRYKPFDFETQLAYELSSQSDFTEIVVDISVMSKYMIMQIICALSKYQGRLHIIYTEPESYIPTEDEYEKNKRSQSSELKLPSNGVGTIVQTPLLNSIIMQRSPSMLIAFLSFNEQLIKALLSKMTPSRLLLVNGVPSNLTWREKATCELHKSVIDEYSRDNPIAEDGVLERRSSTLDYQETFQILAGIYHANCTNYRLIISPTGSKMQALACALMKLCCEDIHIEYPIPESYFVEEYSSSAIKEIHEVTFENLANSVRVLRDSFKLSE